MFPREFNIRVEARDPNQQKDIAKALEELQRDFSELNVRIEAESKELVPGEVMLTISVAVASAVLAKVFLRFLDKLWDRLKTRGIKPILSSLDSVQRTAEDYLLNVGIGDFEIVKREDRGLYVFFVFKSKDASHRLYISKSDMSIIKYEKVGS